MSVEDVVKITATVNLYSAALDGHRPGLFEKVFAPDVVADFGGGAAFTGRDTLIDAFDAIHRPFHSTQHIVSGHVIKVDGDRGYCFSHVHAYFTRMIENRLCVFDSTGWYDDTLRRERVGWLIERRVSRMVTAQGDHRVMQAMPGIDTDFQLLALAEENAAGRVAALAAL